MENFGTSIAWSSPSGNYVVVDDDYLVDEGGEYILLA